MYLLLFILGSVFVVCIAVYIVKLIRGKKEAKMYRMQCRFRAKLPEISPTPVEVSRSTEFSCQEEKEVNICFRTRVYRVNDKVRARAHYTFLENKKHFLAAGGLKRESMALEETVAEAWRLAEQADRATLPVLSSPLLELLGRSQELQRGFQQVIKALTLLSATATQDDIVAGFFHAPEVVTVPISGNTGLLVFTYAYVLCVGNLVDNIRLFPYTQVNLHTEKWTEELEGEVIAEEDAAAKAHDKYEINSEYQGTLDIQCGKETYSMDIPSENKAKMVAKALRDYISLVTQKPHCFAVEQGLGNPEKIRLALKKLREEKMARLEQEREKEEEYRTSAVSQADLDISAGVLVRWNCAQKNATLPPGLFQEIGERAITSSELEELTIPEGVRVIRKSALFFCQSLKQVTLPDSLETIEESAFSYCENLEKVKFGKNLHEIGDRAFNGCKSLKEVQLPNGLLKLGDYSFSRTALGEIALPDSLQTIGKSTFSGCESLEKVKFGKNLHEIGDRAFNGCKSLKEVQLPNGLLKLGDYSFSETALGEIALPDSLQTTGESTFSGCENLEKVKFGKNLCEIGYGAFKGCKSLKEAQLPNGLLKLGNYSFSGTALEEISLPDSLETIEPSVFHGCNSLRAVSLGVKIREIPAYLFQELKVLERVIVHRPIDCVGTRAFENCSRFQGFQFDCDQGDLQEASMNFPEGLKSIGAQAFSGCGSLKRVRFPMSLLEIGERAFMNCSSLQQVEGLEENQWMGKRVFFKTPWLASLAQNGFVVIQDFLEAYVGQSENIEIPAGVKEIGARAFENNRRIESVVIPEGVVSIGNRAFGACKKLSFVQIPDSVTQIAGNAFATCPKLTIFCYRGSAASTYRIAHKIPGEYLARERKRSSTHSQTAPEPSRTHEKKEVTSAFKTVTSVSDSLKVNPNPQTGVDVLSPEERKLIIDLRRKKREEQSKLGVDPTKDRPFEETGFQPDRVSLVLQNSNCVITSNLVVLRFVQSKPVGLFHPAEYEVFFADRNGRIISDVKTVKADIREGDLFHKITLNLVPQRSPIKEKSCELILRYPGADHNAACKIPFQMNLSFVSNFDF